MERTVQNEGLQSLFNSIISRNFSFLSILQTQWSVTRGFRDPDQDLHIVSYFALGQCPPSLSGIDGLSLSHGRISDLLISNENNGWVGLFLRLEMKLASATLGMSDRQRI